MYCVISVRKKKERRNASLGMSHTDIFYGVWEEESVSAGGRWGGQVNCQNLLSCFLSWLSLLLVYTFTHLIETPIYFSSTSALNKPFELIEDVNHGVFQQCEWL